MDGRWALALSIGERALIALVMGRVGGLPWTHEAQIIPRWFSVGSRGWIEANGLADISVHGCGEGTPQYVELFDRQASSFLTLTTLECSSAVGRGGCRTEQGVARA